MLASAAAVFASTYLLAGLIALAPRKAGYSHIKHSISELGEIGAPDQRLVALGIFLPIGLMLLLIAIALRPDRPAAALALCVAVGYVGAAAFPCDPGSPLFGSARQLFHNIAGAVEYAGGGFALMTVAEHHGQPFRAAGFVVLGVTIALSLLPTDSVRGLVQRLAETCLFAGLALAAWPSS